MGEGGRLAASGPTARHSRPHRSDPHPGPVRTCVGCRSTGSRSDLLRVVASQGGSPEPALVVDTRRSMPGRGAWLHPDRACLELAERRRAFARALRLAGPLDPGAIGEYLATHGR